MHFIETDAIFNGHKFLEKGSILVLNSGHQTEDILPANSIESSRVEKLRGILCPGFVNVHCHLELSHLRNIIPQGTGLPEFGKQIISKRGEYKSGEMLEHMQEANRFMQNRGIVAVGDISNTSDSFRVKADSGIFYYTFLELIGINPSHATEILEKGESILAEAQKYGLNAGLSPHAPYSVSPALLMAIKEWCELNHAPYTIHNQESEQELKFLSGQESDFDDLFRFLKIDLSWYKAPGKSGLEYMADFLPKNKSILVHNTFSSAKDIQWSSNLNNYWCFCPRANDYIEEHYPDFKIFKPHNKKLCLGTDSLASNHDLDVLEEANVLLKSGVFELSEILKMLSLQGAQALGLSDKFGEIAKGRKSGLNLIEHSANQLRFLKKIA